MRHGNFFCQDFVRKITLVVLLNRKRQTWTFCRLTSDVLQEMVCLIFHYTVGGVKY